MRNNEIDELNYFGTILLLVLHMDKAGDKKISHGKVFFFFSQAKTINLELGIKKIDLIALSVYLLLLIYKNDLLF